MLKLLKIGNTGNFSDTTVDRNDVVKQPSQPRKSYYFSRRTFRSKLQIVFHNSNWFLYDKNSDTAFCFTCVKL